jgi:hypothetical protein
MKTDKIDLGKAFKDFTEKELNLIWTNPFLIHRIQDNLCALQGDGILIKVFRENAAKHISGVIQMIIDQYKDNPSGIEKMVGRETLKLIEEYKGISLN